MVEAPVLGVQYYGTIESGGFKTINGAEERLDKIPAFDEKMEGLKVVASRSHLNEETQSFLNKLNAPEIVSMGSSLKFMMVAEGKADIYPRFAPTMEWDTAAAHAVISALGGRVETPEGVELIYNKHNLLNPYFRVYQS